MSHITDEQKKLTPVIGDMDDKKVDIPDYSETEKLYLQGLQSRLEIARNDRDNQHEEFDNMDYLTYYEENEKWANSYIQPKKNKEETNFTSGVVRQKLFALLAAVNNLDLSPDISAFSKDGIKIQALGDAMEDIFLKAEDLENDAEKKLLRQYEMLKHGSVFVEEIWDERFIKEKKMSSKFDGKLPKEEVKMWSERLKKVFAHPSRNIIPGTNVYLGDITQYDITKQPYIFTLEVTSYEEVKATYGEWERWNFVTKDKKAFSSSTDEAILFNNWRLTGVQKGKCEIIKYQDKWNNEYALLINGVLMTPVGLPLPWGWEDYNIAQQNTEPIHAKFAYGNSFVRKVRANAALFDEMLRLAILKTQKSFQPPRYNISGKIVSSRMFMPGKINYGLQPGTLPPIEGENAGVNNSELAMIQEISKAIDNQSVSPVFTGQATERQETATAIIEMQRQAKLVLGNTIFACSMLEWKLSWLRLYNVLKNWFNDDAIDQVRATLSVERNIPGRGLGRRMIIPTKELPSSLAIAKTEETLEAEEGVPVKLIFLNPDELKSAKLTWQSVIRPRERVTSETQKLMFRAFMADAQLFGPLLNLEHLGERFASVWGEDPSKLFTKPEEMKPSPTPEGEGTSGIVSPGMNLPTPEKAAGREMASAMGMTQ